MAGAAFTLTYDDAPVRAAAARLAAFPQKARSMWDAIGAAGVTSTQLRFQAGAGPGGIPWKPSKRALKTGTKTLIDHGYLYASQTHNVLDNGVEWGSAMVYAGIQQHGGTITRYAHSQKIFRRVNKKGELNPRFVKKSKSNFESWATVGEYTITLPARPFLGIDSGDVAEMEAIAARHELAAWQGSIQ